MMSAAAKLRALRPLHDGKVARPSTYTLTPQHSLPACTRAPPSTETPLQIQSERQAALARALEKGYVENYSGDRVGFRGARFRIEGATLFNVTSPTGGAGQLDRGRARGMHAWRETSLFGDGGTLPPLIFIALPTSNGDCGRAAELLHHPTQARHLARRQCCPPGRTETQRSKLRPWSGSQ